jgi:RIO kinase 2
VKISKLHRGGTYKAISNIHKHKLVYHEAKIYDGYRLTYLGYDFLCLKAMSMRGLVVSVGSKIGVGKESDIYACAGPNDEALVLKLARLGRISFRSIKNKRDYLLKRKSASWLYMSRLAAFREFSYMEILFKHGLPIPKPYDWSRHGVLMERVDGINLSAFAEAEDPAQLYQQLMDIILLFGSFGLIHCDFNEFNLMIRPEDGKITVIDFPQMVSVSHENAQWYFERDVECIVTFFKKRFQFESDKRAEWSQVKPGAVRLDVLVKASGVNSLVGLPLQRREAQNDDSDSGDEEAAKPEESRLADEQEVPDDRPGSEPIVREEEVVVAPEEGVAEATIEIPLDDPDAEEIGREPKKEKKKKVKEPKEGQEMSAEDLIRKNVRKEIRKGREAKINKSSKRQGKREKQRQGQRAVKDSGGGGGGGGGGGW